MQRPRLLILSHALPFPLSSGQTLRIHYMLAALRERFHLTFVTVAAEAQREAVAAKLGRLVDRAIVLPSLYPQSRLGRLPHVARSLAYQLRTGLRRSNYVLGRIEFTPERLAAAIRGEERFDAVLYEYWHAADSLGAFDGQDVPAVLDMHNVLWRAYDAEMRLDRWIPAPLREHLVRKYRQREQTGWRRFDGLIAINREEYAEVRAEVPAGRHVFYTPMGVELEQWPYSWQPAAPARVAYYGGMGTKRNQEGALRVLRAVMPAVWKRYPQAEYWIIGSKPPASIQALASDPRVRVTGFVKDLPPLLGTMSALVCPFDGTYGFRSRMVEVLACGVPSVCTPDAVSGMELVESGAVRPALTDAELAAETLKLLDDPAEAERLSRHGRRTVEDLFSYQNTYECLARDMSEWALTRHKENLGEVGCHLA